MIDRFNISVSGDLDLSGFLGLKGNHPTGFQEITYRMDVDTDASEEELEDLRRTAEQHSPNAQTMARAVRLTGKVVKTVVDTA